MKRVGAWGQVWHGHMPPLAVAFWLVHRAEPCQAPAHGTCRGTRVVPTLAQLETQYGDKVQRVFRDYPMDQRHPGARQAHAAARCASEQGKCWASHNALFAHAPKTSPEPRKASAQDVGLDVAAFEQCVSSGTYQTTVPQDVDEGTRAGVTGLLH